MTETMLAMTNNMAVDIKLLKQLREQTGAGVADIRKAIESALLMEDNKVDQKRLIELALENLKKEGLDKAASKSDREVKAGVVETYSHNGKIGVLVELLCETDFVAKTADFKTLAHEVAMQIASMDPKDSSELLKQEYIRDNSQTVDNLVKAAIAKLGENIQVGNFSRIELGK